MYSGAILWSVIFQERRLPIELCRIIFYQAYSMNHPLRLELLENTVRKKWKRRFSVDPNYCSRCGEIMALTLSSRYCRCE